jgi:hypothetical protein
MNILRRGVWRTGATFVALAGVLAVSLTAPIPAMPDDGREAVTRIVRERLPGWIVERVDPSWEGAYIVVTMCAGREMGFQYVPGHGLGPDDAWLQPSDAYSRERLSEISDHWRYLVWYGDPAMIDTLSCREELAGERPSAIDPSVYD